MLWSKHVYCVAIAFKMTEQVEQQICIKFCVKLEHSSMEAIWMIQKAAAMGTWWLAASSQQHAAYVSHLVQSFWQTSNHPGDSAPLQTRFGTLQLLSLSKTKITLEREDISDGWWDSGKYDGAADGSRTYVRSQGAYFEGNWGIIVLCMYNVSCILYFLQ